MANLRADNLTGTGGRNAIDGSVFFDGESSYLSMASGEIISGTGFGTNDFTIEFWINQGVNASNYTGIFNLKASTTTDRFQVAFQSSTIQVYTDTSTWRDTGYAPVSGQWEHIAFVRNYSGNTLKMYANGVEKWSVSNNHDYDEAFETFIGLHSSAYGYLEGYISNLRVLNGTALYTTNNFTPPTEKLTIVENTVLLCCQDSDNSTQEATGKTITAYGNLDYSLVGNNLITNGNFDTGTVYGWTLASGSRSLGTGQSGTFGDGNHLVLTGGNMYQAFTTKIGRTYFVNAQSNGGDSSYISTSTSTGDAIITDIRSSPQTGKGVRGQKSFVATQTTYYVILAGGGTGNFDTVSVYESESPKAPKVLPPVGVDEGVTFEGDIKMNSQGHMYFPTGDTSQRGRGRGLHMTGYSGGEYNSIVYVNIQSMGNSIDFGDMTENVYSNVGGGNGIRGIFAGGYSGNNSPDTDLNIIDYVTFATTGNATTFGDTNYNIRYPAAVSNSTRMLICGGGAPRYSVVDYITIASAGDAVSWGSLIGSDSGKRGSFCNSVMSPTRGIVCAGQDSTGTQVKNMTYMTIATLGSAADFGDLSTNCSGSSGGNCSSNTRGVIQLGMTSPNRVNTLEYVTIATTGDSKDFGDLTQQKNATSPCSNSTRGVFFGGGLTPNGPTTNTIDAVTIATTGNAYDFGDIVQVWGGSNTGTQLGSATSDSHGGLS